MTKTQKAEMKEFFEEMDVVKGMEATYSGDIDMPGDIPLLEDEFIEVEEEEEYSEEEVEALMENVSLEDIHSNLSFDDIKPKKVANTGVKYQLKEKIVTPHFLILRDLVKRTPTVCSYRDCFYDGAKAIGFKDYDHMPEKKRRIALLALERHIQAKHKFTDTDIIDEGNIPSSWMSPQT